MPTGRDRSTRLKALEDDVEELDLKNGHISETNRNSGRRFSGTTEEATIKANSPRSMSSKSAQRSPAGLPKTSQSPIASEMSRSEHEEVVGGEITVKLEPGQPPKLARSSSQKIWTKPSQLFDDYPSRTEEAQSKFDVIPACIYGSKYMGSTEHGMDCDCTEEWDSSTKTNAACGEDSDCINRATKIECTGDCGCGPECQNQRFQQRQYADVTVIQTEKKGYGLRADTNLRPHDFIFEYIGEVINEANFRRRTIQYNDEGIKHFYFMSLTKNEFVDATKKGNLGRFCNHSCNPNCYVDKWVVGDKLRMGIFAERKIKAGEELVFNYNVDRYGADPQPCYCGEPNCTGYIGGKTQTERATQLSLVTIEALGIDDGNGWDTAVAKRPRKKKAGEDDEEYVNNVQPKSLDVDAVTKVMATLMQCKEKWIAVKVLGRIQRCDDEKVRNRVVRMHGYRILSSTLSLWKDDFNVAQQVLDIIEKLPRLTRNKISDSGIESTVDSLKDCGNGRIEMQVAALLEEWSTLEVAYRIPRKKREMNDTATPEKLDRYSRRDSAPRERRGRSRSRSKSRSRSRSRSIDAPRGPAAPSGPRGGFPQRNPGFFGGPRPPPRPRPFLPPLPAGWHSALSNGTPYYYTATGETTWTRPIMAAAPPPPPPKPTSANPALDAIIKEIEESKERERKEKASASATPQAPTGEPSSERRKEGKDKWRSYSEEKQKKLYENTLFPHIKYVVDKYKHKLPRDDLKKFAKQVAKKLVESDYKNHRVQDPSRITSKQESQVKKYVKDFFDKVVAQKRAHDKKREERRAEREKEEGKVAESLTLATAPEEKNEDLSDGEPGMDLSDYEGGDKSKQDSATPITPADSLMNGNGGLKRKRDPERGDHSLEVAEEGATPTKRPRSETPPPPPPPPPLPAADMHVGAHDISEQATSDSTMDVDAFGGHDLTNRANGCGPPYDQDSMSESPTTQNDPPSRPSLVDGVQIEALEVTASDTGDLTLDSPDSNPLNQGLALESERDGGFASKHFQGVQGIKVHQGS